MFIETHIIQNFAPSNLNRDDTGNPKDTEFGGARRARISSQCIKRSIRLHPVFTQATQVDLGVRTRWVSRLITQALVERGKPSEHAQTLGSAFASHLVKVDEKKAGDKDEGHTKVLLYLSSGEIDAIAENLVAQWDVLVSELEKGKSATLEEMAESVSKDWRKRTSAPDIALFGRMLAERPELNIDAACQVAHAISTHRANMEMDFYTAVDDLSKDEETGAGMMGVTGFNSACFYRYSCVQWEQLVANLNGDAGLARKTVEGFLRATALAIPTGKQTSFAAQNLPDFLLGVVREDGQAWSLANAFETPVRPNREGGLVRPSVERLDDYWGRLAKVYGGQGLHPVALALSNDLQLTNLMPALTPSLDAWVGGLVTLLPGA